jgi:hypothetical protein
MHRTCVLLSAPAMREHTPTPESPSVAVDLEASLAAMSLSPSTRFRVRTTTTVEILDQPTPPSTPSRGAIPTEAAIATPASPLGKTYGSARRSGRMLDGARAWTVRPATHKGQTSGPAIVHSA